MVGDMTLDDGPMEEEKRTVANIHARYDPRIVGLEEASYSFAKVAVQSAFLINGGALVAAPAYLAAISPLGVTLAAVTPSFICFVVGIFFAATCAYAAYINFQAVAFVDMHQRDMEVLAASEKYTPQFLHRMKVPRDAYRKVYERKAKRAERLAGLTLALGNVFGLASFASFVAGCFFLARTLLS
jgi:hypothetical protein